MAEKFEYTREWTDAEAFPLLGFTKSWENPEDYPTIELDETQVRKDMQSLHDEVKNYINDKLIPAVLAEDATEAARAAAEAQRIENENARIAAEQARTTAESERADAETERAAAESARNTAEQAREAAEQARADETAGIVAQATEQAVIASNAASEASSSASGAFASASAAAASASSASDSASASASSAAAAQASAAEALSSKNSAKSEADRAKSEADRAAEIVGGDFVKASEKGAANGVATLGEDGKVPASQLPDISGADIPITSTPDDNVTIWIDPDEDDQTESFYTKTETNTLLQNKADLDESGKVPESQLPSLGFKPQIVVTAPTGSAVTATQGSKVYTASESGGTWTFKVEDYGTYTITATKGDQTATGEVIVEAVQQYAVELKYIGIYGVTWDGTSSQALTRTDDAAGFTDPVPYVAGASSYGSPFDNLMPWAGMTKETRTGGVMVKIPKFWYKLTKSGNTLSIQIADAAVDGFSVCPACMDRGDGKGERDAVYVGRYHCGANNYKSVSGVKPKANVTRANFRSSIHSLGSNIWQLDFATRFTIWLLYIVEFANWNSQKTIGKGCGDNSATGNMGYTDSMPYHTGITQSSRDTYGLGTQYRNIEGLWDNVYDWCDGCYNSNNGLMIILNPSSFSDSSGGQSAGTPASGWIAAWNVTTSGGFPMFINGGTSGGGENAAVGDSWNFYASGPCVCVGGDYNQSGSRGLFFVSYSDVSNADGSRGSRVLELP